MKKIILLAAGLIALSTAAMAQQPESYPSYIVVTGNAEREIVPNEIYVKIVIDESDSKGKITIAEQERKMIAELKKLGIDVDKDLQVGDMSGDMRSYVFRRDRVETQKSYILKLGDADTLAKVFKSLGNIDISQMGLVKVTRNDLDKIKMELRVEAMRNAQETARTLAEAIGQSVGKAFVIMDNNYSGGGTIYYDNAAPVARAKMAVMAESAVEDTSLQFQNLKLEHSVNVRFILE